MRTINTVNSAKPAESSVAFALGGTISAMQLKKARHVTQRASTITRSLESAA